MKKLIVTCLATLLCFSQSAKCEGLWHVVRGEEDKRTWLVAYEEASFIKERIGEWLPIDLYKTGDSGMFLWKIARIERKEDEVHIKLLIKYGENLARGYEFHFYDEGKDEVLDCVVWEKSGETRVSIPRADGTLRDILFGGAPDIGALKGKYRVSKAMPAWRWQPRKIYVADLNSVPEAVDAVARSNAGRGERGAPVGPETEK